MAAPEFIRGVLARELGAWDAIERDYGLARMVLQIVMEERTGRNVRGERGTEDRQFAASAKELTRGPR